MDEINLSINKMVNILEKILDETSDFSGLGLILYEDISLIPIFPMRKDVPYCQQDLMSALEKISSYKSSFHDGFHLLNTDFQLTHISQYFSPPIVQNVKLVRNEGFGGRYLAALFGSYIPGVRLIGIASTNFGIAIFRNGEEIYYRKPKSDSFS